MSPLALGLPGVERPFLPRGFGALGGVIDDLPREEAFYKEAVKHAREMRNRYSVLDLADDAGLLDAFLADEA